MSKEQFFKAVGARDIAGVRGFLEAGIAVDSRDELGQTALHIAAYNKDPDIMETLINKRANVDVQDNDGWAPLHRAVYRDSVECSALLLKVKANPNITTPEIGYTPLMGAAAHSNKGLVELLLKHKAKVNVVAKSGNTALHMAANDFSLKKEEGKSDVIELLLKNGAKSIANKLGDTPQDIVGFENPCSKLFDEMSPLVGESD